MARVDDMEPFVLFGAMLIWPLPSLFIVMALEHWFVFSSDNAEVLLVLLVDFVLSVWVAWVLTDPAWPWMR